VHEASLKTHVLHQKTIVLLTDIDWPFFAEYSILCRSAIGTQRANIIPNFSQKTRNYNKAVFHHMILLKINTCAEKLLVTMLIVTKK